MSGILGAFVGGGYGNRPYAPTIGTATATGATTASVSYTAPIFDGGLPITSYTATSSPGGFTGSLSTSGSGTINVSGLTTNTFYTFTVTATNATGTGPASAASNSIWVAPSPVLSISGWTTSSLGFTVGSQMNVVDGYGDVIIVPNTVITIDLYVWGRGAGTDTYGGYTTGRMTLNTGQSYLISSGAYGYSGIFLGTGRIHANSLAIAGASGQPSTENFTGGYGGGTTGQTSPTGLFPAQGGTQSAGGAAGDSGSESTGQTAGGPLYGGTGGTKTASNPGWGNGGAGGAGYYGGGGGPAGGSYQGGGAGGSGYFNTSYISSGSTTQAGGRSSPYRGSGGDPGQGQVVIVCVSLP